MINRSTTMKYRLFLRLLLVFIIASYGVQTSAQEDDTEPSQDTESAKSKAKLYISGTLYDDGRRMEDVVVSIKSSNFGEKEVYSDAAGKFKMEFELDDVYMMYFTKSGFVEKMVEVDTRNIDEDNRRYDFYYKGWKVDMFPSDLDVDFSSLKKPVAKVVFNPADEGFGTDKKYERVVRPSREKLIKDVYAAYDDRDLKVEGAFEDYMLAVKDGDLFLKEGDYENALMQYEAAKSILPNEAYPDKQIKKTMAMMQANQSVDEQYANYLAAADEAFDSKDWEVARENYEGAQGVKPKMDYPKDQIDLIVKNIAAEKLAAEQMKEKEKLDLYNSIVAQGDSLLKAKDYSASKVQYNKALDVLNKEYPKSKIKEINNLLAQNAKSEKAYEDLLANANEFMNEKKYNQAMETFNTALGMKPEAEEPKAKIKEIEGLLAGLAAMEELNAKLAAKKEADLQAKYDETITTADALLVDKVYDKAKAEYEQASGLKPKEEYPKNQIALINATVLKLEGLDKQYAKLMADAVKNKSVAKWEVAKSNYQAALELKPNEQAPKDGIAEIDAKLASLAADQAAQQKAIDDKYAGFVAEGDAMMALEKYTEAQTAYKQALTVKSKEEYPKSQLAVIDDKMKAIALAAAASEKEAKELAEKEASYNQSIGKADQLFKSNNLVAAKTEYERALTILPGKTYPVSQMAEIDSKLTAIAAADAAKAKELADVKAKEDEYAAIIVKADAAFTKADYVNARLEYQNAQKVFADRLYPAQQIQKMEAIELAAKEKAEQEALAAAKAEENKKRFDELVAEGDALVGDKDYTKAKYKYQAALQLFPGDEAVNTKLKAAVASMEEARKLAEFRAKNDTEFNRQLAVDYPNGLNETTKGGGKTTTRIVIVDGDRGDEYKKEVYSYGAVFYFKNKKKIDQATYNRETK